MEGADEPISDESAQEIPEDDVAEEQPEEVDELETTDVSKEFAKKPWKSREKEKILDDIQSAKAKYQQERQRAEQEKQRADRAEAERRRLIQIAKQKEQELKQFREQRERDNQNAREGRIDQLIQQLQTMGQADTSDPEQQRFLNQVQDDYVSGKISWEEVYTDLGVGNKLTAAASRMEADRRLLASRGNSYDELDDQLQDTNASSTAVRNVTPSIGVKRQRLENQAVAPLKRTAAASRSSVPAQQQQSRPEPVKSAGAWRVSGQQGGLPPMLQSLMSREANKNLTGMNYPASMCRDDQGL